MADGSDQRFWSDGLPYPGLANSSADTSGQKFWSNGLPVSTLTPPAATVYTLAVGAGAFTETGVAVRLYRNRALAPAAGSFALTGKNVTLVKEYHRYWRVYTTTSSAQISDLEFYTSLTGGNIASGGTAIASEGTAANGFDGNAATVWTAAASPSWLGYDFGAGNDKARPKAVAIGQGASGKVYNFDVQWSDDGSTWTTSWSHAGAATEYLTNQPLTPFTNTTDLASSNAAHQHWRIHNIDTVGGAPYSTGFAEISMNAGGSSNLASYAPFAGSSAYDSPPANALDGNPSTYFLGSSAQVAADWMYKFLDKVKIGKVGITNRADEIRNSPTNFSIQYSDDGVTWTTAKNVQMTWTTVGQTINTYLISPEPGSFTLSGKDAALRYANKMLTLGAGSFALGGQSVAFTTNHALSLAPGSFTLTGSPVGMIRVRSMAAAAASFILDGQPSTFAYSRALNAAAAAITLTGQDAALIAQRRLSLDPASFAATEQDAGLKVTRLIAADAGSFQVSGNAVTTIYLRTMPIGGGSFTVTGEAARVRRFPLSVIVALDGKYEVTSALHGVFDTSSELHGVFDTATTLQAQTL